MYNYEFLFWFNKQGKANIFNSYSLIIYYIYRILIQFLVPHVSRINKNDVNTAGWLYSSSQRNMYLVPQMPLFP